MIFIVKSIVKIKLANWLAYVITGGKINGKFVQMCAQSIHVFPFKEWKSAASWLCLWHCWCLWAMLTTYNQVGSMPIMAIKIFKKETAVL